MQLGPAWYGILIVIAGIAGVIGFFTDLLIAAGG